MFTIDGEPLIVTDMGAANGACGNAFRWASPHDLRGYHQTIKKDGLLCAPVYALPEAKSKEGWRATREQRCKTSLDRLRLNNVVHALPHQMVWEGQHAAHTPTRSCETAMYFDDLHKAHSRAIVIDELRSPSTPPTNEEKRRGRIHVDLSQPRGQNGPDRAEKVRISFDVRSSPVDCVFFISEISF